MTDHVNPYEAPKAELKSDLEVSAEQAYFFTASPVKLVVMSLCTFGFYELYWFYKNWVIIKHRAASNIMPVWRAVFAPFWGFAAFDEVNKAAVEHGVPTSLSAGWLGLAYLLLSITSNGPDPYWLLSIFSFAPMLGFNALAIEVNQKVEPEFRRNSDFTPWNVLAIVVGGSLLVLTIIGTFFVDVLNDIPF